MTSVSTNQSSDPLSTVRPSESTVRIQALGYTWTIAGSASSFRILSPLDSSLIPVAIGVRSRRTFPNDHRISSIAVQQSEPVHEREREWDRGQERVAEERLNKQESK